MKILRATHIFIKKLWLLLIIILQFSFLHSSAQYQNQRKFYGSAPVENILEGNWYDREAQVLIEVLRQGNFPDRFNYFVTDKSGKFIERGTLCVYVHIIGGDDHQVIDFLPNGGQVLSWRVDASHINRISFYRFDRGNRLSRNWWNAKFGG